MKAFLYEVLRLTQNDKNESSGLELVLTLLSHNQPT